LTALVGLLAAVWPLSGLFWLFAGVALATTLLGVLAIPAEKATERHPLDGN
jgi:hypothetical protein